MAKPYDPKDFYYRKAKAEGLRARSAFKIDEIVRRHRLVASGQAVLDLGAAPGGFLQVLADAVGERGAAVDELDLGNAVVKDQELKMAIQLAEMGAADEFHPENYRDEVAERIRAQIQKKIDGEEITATAEDEPKAQVIDLMEALRKSLGGAKAAKPAPAAKMPIKAEAKRKPAKQAPGTSSRAKARAR